MPKLGKTKVDTIVKTLRYAAKHNLEIKFKRERDYKDTVFTLSQDQKSITLNESYLYRK